MPAKLLAPNTDLGPYSIGDDVPAWVLTVEGLDTPAAFDGAALHIDNPDGTAFLDATGTWALTVVSTDLVCTYTPPATAFVQSGDYRAELTLLVSAKRLTVQPFVFFVREGPFSTT